MNGFIASLLVLMMTGTVFSQQGQSNNFDSSNGGTAASNRLLSRFLFVLKPNQVAELKAAGYLRSDPIGPDETFDHVVFHGSDDNSENSSLLPVDISRYASYVGNSNSLVFTLDDDLLRQMNDTGLIYVIPDRDLNKYREVIVFYEKPPVPSATIPVNQRSRQDSMPSRSNIDSNLESKNQFGERDRFAVNRNKNRIDDEKFWQQGLGKRSADFPGSGQGKDFIGPRLPGDEFYDRQQESNGSRSFTPRIGSIAEQSRIRRDVGEQQRQVATDRQSDPSLNRLDRLARRNRDFDMDTGFSGAAERPLDRSISRSNDRGFRPTESFVENRGDINFNTHVARERNSSNGRQRPQRSAMATEIESLKQELYEERRLRNRTERDLEQVDQARIAAEDDLQREKDFNRRYPVDYPSGQYPNRHRRDYADRIVATEASRDAYVGMPAKSNVTPRPSARAPELSINGPADAVRTGDRVDGGLPAETGTVLLSAEAERIKKNNAALWFIMLCSVGLNFYLALISRSFYVRYEELADEIRETFTSSSV